MVPPGTAPFSPTEVLMADLTDAERGGDQPVLNVEGGPVTTGGRRGTSLLSRLDQTIPSLDASHDETEDGGVVIKVQRGQHALTVVREFPVEESDGTTVLRELVVMVEGYLEEGRLG